jgi:hypothetical protein
MRKNVAALGFLLALFCGGAGDAAKNVTMTEAKKKIASLKLKKGAANFAYTQIFEAMSKVKPGAEEGRTTVG